MSPTDNGSGADPDPAAGLTTLRRRLDGIDEQLLDLLGRRLATCVQIARFKQDNDIPMMQPGRIAVVHERAERFAVAHHIDPGFLHRLYDEIIAEACRVEDEAMGATR